MPRRTRPTPAPPSPSPVRAVPAMPGPELDEAGRPLPALRSADEALHVVRTAVDLQRPGSVCLLLDHAHQRICAIAIDGGGEPDAVDQVSDLLESIAVEEPFLGAVVLASVRPEHPFDSDDLDRWWQLDEQFETIGVELLEWFVIGRGGASIVAMRALSGSPSLWRRTADDGPMSECERIERRVRAEAETEPEAGRAAAGRRRAGGRGRPTAGSS